MSNTVFPTLPGLDIKVKRSDVYATAVKTTPSGRKFRTSLSLTPISTYELTYNALRLASATPDYQQLAAHFAQHKGRGESFPFLDPEFNAETLGAFGVGDGVTKSFQLLRHVGAIGYPVYDLNGSPSVYINAVLTAAYTITSGLITFTAAPAVGAALTWSGGYYVRCAYSADNLDCERVMMGYYKSGVVKLELDKP